MDVSGRQDIMKLVKYLALTTLLAQLAAPAILSSAEKPAKSSAKPKPYTLKTCIVSDEKLGEMGDPYVFTHEGREVKLCCKSCLKDFKKDTAKYIKKIDEAEKKKS